MALWSTVNDFIDNPEKFTAQYAYEKIEKAETKQKEKQLKLL
jgi:hypothetical protein